RLYQRAASHGDRDAMAEVARCYYHGIGTHQNLAKALEWYKKAADYGDAEAQYTLGRAYEFGEGVKTDLDKAIRWYGKAAAQGDEKAKTAVADLIADLAQEQ